MMLNFLNILRRALRTENLKTGNRLQNNTDLITYYKFCINTLKKSGIDFSKIENALEVGPGDSCGLAVILNNMGVQKIDLIDKFNTEDIISANKNLYLKLSSVFNGKEITDLNTQNINILDFRKDLLQRANDPAHLRYDLIYSVSVCEHLWPISEHLRAMNRLLSRDGSMLHVINFTDHGMFSPEHNRFYFRKIHPWAYKLAMRAGGRPNRALPSEILTELKQLDLEAQVIPIRTHTRVLEDGEIWSHRSIPADEMIEISEVYKFKKSMDKTWLEDIAIGSALIIARKIK